jgi:hypothetical protein
MDNWNERLIEWLNRHNPNTGPNRDCLRLCGGVGPKAWNCSLDAPGCLNQNNRRNAMTKKTLEVGKCYRYTSPLGKLYFHVVAKVRTLKSGDCLLVEMDQREYGTTRTPPYEVDIWPIGKEHNVEDVSVEEFKEGLSRCFKRTKI